MSTDVQVFMWRHVFNFLGYIPGIGIAGWLLLWCCITPSLHTPYALVCHSGALFLPPHHSPYFQALMLLPPLLFSLRSSFFLSFWVQILCVTKGPTQLTFSIKASSSAASWESHATPCVCFLTPDLLALDCSYSVRRSYYLLRVYSSLLHLDSDFWIYFNIPTAL